MGNHVIFRRTYQVRFKKRIRQNYLRHNSFWDPDTNFNYQSFSPRISLSTSLVSITISHLSPASRISSIPPENDPTCMGDLFVLKYTTCRRSVKKYWQQRWQLKGLLVHSRWYYPDIRIKVSFILLLSVFWILFLTLSRKQLYSPEEMD